MSRTLDLTALRALVTIAEQGGITRAAAVLNLTQSAVSMQIKRLEEALDTALLERSGRGVVLTAAGEDLVTYARRMLQLNDEALGRLADRGQEGQLVLGVPYDIVYPFIPRILQRFSSEFPRIRVQLVTTNTADLKQGFGQGGFDAILTTEIGCDAGGEMLGERPLIWVGAPGGTAWRSRPLRLALARVCAFRAMTVRALDAAGIPWELAVESESDRALEAAVNCDLAVHMLLAGSEPPNLERIDHGGTLPELGTQRINLYAAPRAHPEALAVLCDNLRQTYRTPEARPQDTTVVAYRPAAAIS